MVSTEKEFKKAEAQLRVVSRNRTGTVFAELAIGCLVCISMSLFALDIGTAMASYSVNDRACRDAARAAAEGSNVTEATNLANRIVQSFASTSPLITSPKVAGVVYKDFGGNPPDGQSPYVTVTCRATARPIAPLKILGLKVIDETFPLVKTYTFPIVKLDVKPGAPTWHDGSAGGAGAGWW